MQRIRHGKRCQKELVLKAKIKGVAFRSLEFTPKRCGNGVYIRGFAGEYLRVEIGRVAELADALDLGSNGEIRAGSTPVVPTNLQYRTAENQPG